MTSLPPCTDKDTSGMSRDELLALLRAEIERELRVVRAVAQSEIDL